MFSIAIGSNCMVLTNLYKETKQYKKNTTDFNMKYV